MYNNKHKRFPYLTVFNQKLIRNVRLFKKCSEQPDLHVDSITTTEMRKAWCWGLHATNGWGSRAEEDAFAFSGEIIYKQQDMQIQQRGPVIWHTEEVPGLTEFITANMSDRYIRRITQIQVLERCPNMDGQLIQGMVLILCCGMRGIYFTVCQRLLGRKMAALRLRSG